MANYVYNRIICSRKAARNLSDFEKYPFWKYLFHRTVLKSGEVELVFDTCGTEYFTDDITTFISINREAIWYCIDDCVTRQSRFRWESDKVVFDSREVKKPSEGIMFYYEFRDNDYRPHKFIMIYDDGSVYIEDFADFRSEKWKLNEAATGKVRDYLSDLTAKWLDAFYTLPSGKELCRELMVNFITEGYYTYLKTSTPSDEIYKDGTAEYMRSGVGILHETVDFINDIFESSGIDIHIESAYYSMSDEQAEKMIKNLSKRKKARTDESGETFKNRVICCLCEKYMLWDGEVLSKKEVRLPTLKLEYDTEKEALRVNYCADLGGEKVLMTEYFPREKVEMTAMKISALAEAHIWGGTINANRQASFLTFNKK